MKYFLMAAILLSTGGSTLAQEDIKAKHAAYALCVEHTEKDPRKAYEYCSAYINKYPNDNPRMIDFAARFVTAHKKISEYLKSVPMGYFTEKTTGWAVYSPGLLATIPSEDRKDPNHSILIKREYGSPDEEKLLVKAEALYKSPEPVELELLKQWNHFAQESVDIPAGEPKWWSGEVNTLLAAELVTTEAVLYYYNISLELINKQGKLKDNSFKFVHSSLKYEASIKKMDVYERAGRNFSGVYVANMTLTWGELCGGLCGFGFTRNKIVVMSPSGEILAMFLDDPLNRLSWIS